MSNKTIKAPIAAWVQRPEYSDRFWQRVAVAASDACWPWLGRTKKGYGYISVRQWSHVASRVAWTIRNGEVPEGLFVLHRCDNPVCVNPDHLFIGTPADNMKDMARKGRSMKGTKNAFVKLTEDQVREIRRRWTLGRVKHHTQILSAEFGVSPTTIGRIIRRVDWAHLDAPVAAVPPQLSAASLKAAW